MNLLLDTNVLSEVQRPAPDPKVVAWLHDLDEDRVFISVASVAEIRRGLRLMPEGRRRETLSVWLDDDLPARFGQRLLPIDRPVASAWGDLMAEGRARGIALSAMDAFFAATARVHDLTLATRNTKDFAAFDLKLLDPWGDR